MTRKARREETIGREKRLLQIIREEGPLSYTEIVGKVSDQFPFKVLSYAGVQKTVTRFLRYWGPDGMKLISTDDEKGRYFWAEGRLSEADYERAIDHSKMLFKSLESGSYVEYPTKAFGWESWKAVRFLAGELDNAGGTSDTGLLISHFRTGYPDFFPDFSGYLHLQRKHGFPLRRAGLRWQYFLEDLLDSKLDLDGLYYNIFGVPVPGIGGNAERTREKFKRMRTRFERKVLSIPKSDLRQSGQLSKKLMGELDFVRMKVAHGTPLAGKCQGCPNVTIKVES